MIQSLIEGISKAIQEEFGEGYNIYTESIGQEMLNPCFYLSVVTAIRKPQINRIILYQNQIAIQYTALSKEPNSELYEVYERLSKCLEFIKVNQDLTNASDSKVEILNNYLRYITNYNFNILRSEKHINMQELRLDSKEKGWLK